MSKALTRLKKHASGYKGGKAKVIKGKNYLQSMLIQADEVFRGMPQVKVGEKYGLDGATIRNRCSIVFRALECTGTLPFLMDHVKRHEKAILLELESLLVESGAITPEKPSAKKIKPKLPISEDMMVNIRRVQHILGGGQKGMIPLHEMELVIMYAEGESFESLAERYQVHPNTIKGRIENRFKSVANMDFNHTFVRENAAEVRLLMVDAIQRERGMTVLSEFANLERQYADVTSKASKLEAVLKKTRAELAYLRDKQESSEGLVEVVEERQEVAPTTAKTHSSFFGRIASRIFGRQGGVA